MKKVFLACMACFLVFLVGCSSSDGSQDTDSIPAKSAETEDLTENHDQNQNESDDALPEGVYFDNNDRPNIKTWTSFFGQSPTHFDETLRGDGFTLRTNTSDTGYETQYNFGRIPAATDPSVSVVAFKVEVANSPRPELVMEGNSVDDLYIEFPTHEVLDKETAIEYLQSQDIELTGGFISTSKSYGTIELVFLYKVDGTEYYGRLNGHVGTSLALYCDGHNYEEETSKTFGVLTPREYYAYREKIVQNSNKLYTYENLFWG